MNEEHRWRNPPEPDRCPRCKEQGKTWEGSDPRCAFRTGVFDGDNWNCATANAIREIAEPDEWSEPVPTYVHLGGFDDQHAGVVNISYIGAAEDERQYDWIGEWLVWSSYKHRGQFEAMWIVNRDDPPHRPTLDEAERIIAYFDEKNLAICEGCKKRYVIRESYAKLSSRHRFCGWRCESDCERRTK